MGETSEGDSTIPPGILRIHTITIESYDLSNDAVDLDTQFTILAAKAEESPQMKKLLLALRDHLVGNFGPGENK